MLVSFLLFLLLNGNLSQMLRIGGVLLMPICFLAKSNRKKIRQGNYISRIVWSVYKQNITFSFDHLPFQPSLPNLWRKIEIKINCQLLGFFCSWVGHFHFQLSERFHLAWPAFANLGIEFLMKERNPKFVFQVCFAMKCLLVCLYFANVQQKCWLRLWQN